MLQVSLLDTMELATFCVRTFSLHKVNPLAFILRYPPMTQPSALSSINFTVTFTENNFDLSSFQLRSRSHGSSEFLPSLNELRSRDIEESRLVWAS